MTVLLQVGDRTITAEEIIPVLAGYQMLPHLMRELVVDQAIADFECTTDEKFAAYRQFYEKHKLNSDDALQGWLNRYGMTGEQLEALMTREIRLEKFKQATWSPKVESYFLKRKTQLDKVIYSLLRTQDAGVAQELYFRIQEEEQSFAELAREYSQGPEAQTGGLIGPVELSTPHPILAKLLSISQPGQLWPPTHLGEWFVIVRLEKFMPTQLDESVRQRLLQELFEAWVLEQVSQAMGEQFGKGAVSAPDPAQLSAVPQL